MAPGSRADRRVPIALSSAARERLLAVLLLTALLVGGGSALLPPVRAAARTLQLMPAFFAQLPVDPSAWGAPAVMRSDLSLGPGFPGALLHVYRPASGRHPAFVISLGVDPAPPDDPRVVRLLTGFARAGYVAVLVESPDLNAELLTTSEPSLIVRAFQTVAGESYVDGRHVGLIGFSVGGSLVLLAAADPRIRDQVRLVEAFGAYDRLESLIRAAVLHQLEENGRTETWQPDDLSVEALRLNLIDGLPSNSERALLQQALPNADPPPASAPAGLSPAGQNVYALLTAADAARFNAAYASLPAAQRQTFEALSPANAVAQIRAPVYLMVDRGDPLVPFSESVQIAAQLRSAGRKPYFSEFDIFRHVDPTRGGNPLIVARDVLRLLMHASAVLAGET